MGTPFPRMASPYALRLRGENPMIEVLSSNVSFNLGESSTLPGSARLAMTLRDGSNVDSPGFWHVVQVHDPGPSNLVMLQQSAPIVQHSSTAACATDVLAADGSNAGATEPTLSLRTWADVERARIDGDGLSCGVLAAASYANLVHDYLVPLRDVPPSAAALTDAFSALSGTLGLTRFCLSNDTHIRTVPDGRPRIYFETDGATVSSAPSPGVPPGTAGPSGVASWAPGEPRSFGWVVNDDLVSAAYPVGREVMSLGPGGDLWIAGDVVLGSNADGVGAARITTDGSNLGINLPPGEAPTCALHVNGSVYAQEGMFMLSDQRIKTDVVPIEDALSKMLQIRGCTYARTDLPPTAPRQLGVLAQNVHAVVPEAVHVDADGRMSVAYGNLVALVVEAVRDVSKLLDRVVSKQQQDRRIIDALVRDRNDRNDRHDVLQTPPRSPRRGLRVKGGERARHRVLEASARHRS